MTAFWKPKLGIVTAILLVAAAAAVVAWRIESRGAAREDRVAKERIQSDVRKSIEKATDGFKLCPLTEPDCNKR